MEAKGLRIGSYVNYMGSEIQATSENIRECQLNQATTNAIELTEEWLIKFGFKEQIGFYKFIGGEWVNSIEVSHNDLNKWYVYYRNFNKGSFDDFVLLRNDLRYVHELQNLYFAITGTELIVSL